MEPMAVNGILEQEELVAVFVNWRELIASNYKLLKLGCQVGFVVSQVNSSIL